MPPHEHAPPIVALATPPGHSAIAVVRLSGTGVISTVNQLFRGKDLTQQATHTLHLGTIVDEAGEVLDEVLIALFRAPHSFTQEESVEISCHGSPYVVQQLVQLLVRHGVQLAQPGEFTQRAFLHGRFDLAQAEAVADLIAADSAAAHRMAMHQMRGQFSAHIQALRAKLLHFAAMLELELDFAEEDIAFADRAALKALLQDLLAHIEPLVHGFALGNAVKSGVHTVIAGKPNAGKSTLLNALLNEERAIVSDTPGTTRDLIEDKLNIGSISFRLVDTAGLRPDTADAIEALGIAKTKEQLQKAALILHLFDLSTASLESIRQTTAQLQAQPTPYIKVGNKIDAAPEALLRTLAAEDFVLISAAKQQNLQALTDRMVALATPPTDAVVVNARHYEHLTKSQATLEAILQSLENQLSTEFLAQDVRTALDELGAITGEVTTDELLGHIFAQFCIGK